MFYTCEPVKINISWLSKRHNSLIEPKSKDFSIITSVDFTCWLKCLILPLLRVILELYSILHAYSMTNYKSRLRVIYCLHFYGNWRQDRFIFTDNKSRMFVGWKGRFVGCSWKRLKFLAGGQFKRLTWKGTEGGKTAQDMT